MSPPGPVPEGPSWDDSLGKPTTWSGLDLLKLHSHCHVNKYHFTFSATFFNDT